MNSENIATRDVGARHTSLVHFLSRYVVPRSAGLLPIWSYVLLQPPIFALWFHTRRLWWRLCGVPLQRLTKTGQDLSGFVAETVMPYNIGNMWIINRARTERLMMIMRAIRGINLAKTRMLVIGPRNEAELLLLSAYGFRMSNLTAIDLFSYAPTVTLMDMHALEFPDSSFDAIYSSFVITYSDDVPKTIRETIRVARNGALVLFAFEHLAQWDVAPLEGNRINGGLDVLLAHFRNYVSHIYWSEDYEREGRYTATLIFRLQK